MRKQISIAVFVSLALAVAVVLRYVNFTSLFSNNENNIPAKAERAVFVDPASVSAEIDKKIDSLSPTPSLSGLGFIVKRIEFEEMQNLAFVEYTDTSIALRLLLKYNYQDEQLNFKVLATYVPAENLGWKLQYGEEPKITGAKTPFIFNADSNQWIEAR